MSSVEIRKVEAADTEMRLDRWFKRHFPALSHGRLEKLLRTGQIRVNGGRVKAADHVSTGDEIRVPPLGEAPKPKHDGGPKGLSPKVAEIAEALRRSIIHRDAEVIVVNKPAGLAVQGGSGLDDEHLDAALDGLIFDATERPRIVHRLDKDTSGVLVLARSRLAAAALTKSFRARDAVKTYWALTVGTPKPLRGKIDLALMKDGPSGHEKMRTVLAEDREEDDDAKKAVTYYAVVEHAGHKVSWLAMRPLTGRTHQLRAHAAFLGTPIVGDGKYGGAEAFLTGGVSRKLHLHARAIDIAHPAGGRLKVKAPLPVHMAESFKMFGFEARDGDDVFAELDE